MMDAQGASSDQRWCAEISSPASTTCVLMQMRPGSSGIGPECCLRLSSNSIRRFSFSSRSWRRKREVSKIFGARAGKARKISRAVSTVLQTTKERVPGWWLLDTSFASFGGSLVFAHWIARMAFCLVSSAGSLKFKLGADTVSHPSLFRSAVARNEVANVALIHVVRQGLMDANRFRRIQSSWAVVH